MKKRKMSKEAQEFISHKVEILMNEGKTRDEALGQAYGMARDLGYRIKKSRQDAKNKEKRFVKSMKGR